MATSPARKRASFGPYEGSQDGTPPGAVLAEELEARLMTQGDLARKMKRPYKLVNEIIHGKKILSADTALDLEAALGIPAAFWMNLEQHYRLAKARARRRQSETAG